MALISRSIFRNWWDDIDRYHREIEDNFRRLTLRDDPWRWPFRSMFRPWRSLLDDMDREVGGTSTIERNYDNYRVTVDLQQFAPEEITVRTDDKYITIEARQQNRKDRYGYVSKEFMRRYYLPSCYDMNRVRPSLSSDGILTITAPRLTWPLPPAERYVPITRTYYPAIKSS